MPKHTPIPQNFIYPEIKPEDYKFGSQELVGVVLRSDGDWRNYTPPGEFQNINDIESSACYKYAQLHTIATIQEEQFDLPDQLYSARFNDQEGATKVGGSPIAAAQSFRHDGIIRESLLPFSEDIKSWDEFNSFKNANEILCRKLGREFLKEWKISWDIVFEMLEPVEQKYRKLRQALKYSPVPLSVLGWYQDDQGLYIKPPGIRDNHLVECVFVDEDNCAWVWDTYAPFLKKLEPYYNFEFGMRWSVDKKKDTIDGISLWESFWNWFRTLFINFKRYQTI